MDFDKGKIKQGIAMITCSALMIIAVIQFRSIISGAAALVSLLKPLFGGVVIAFVLNRPYEWLNRCFAGKFHVDEGIAGTLAAVAVYLMLFGGIAAIILVVVPQLVQNIQTFIAGIDDVMVSLQSQADKITQMLGIKIIDVSEVIDFIGSYASEIEQLIKEALPKIADMTMNAVSAVVNVFVAIAFSVYLMNGKKQIIGQIQRMVSVFLPQRVNKGLSVVMDTVITVFDNYVAGQTLEALILGSLCFIGMLIQGLDYAGMVGAVVTVTAMIPILGAYIGGSIGTVLLLCVSPKKAVIFLIFFVLLQQVENNIIFPRVVGNKIGLPGIWVLLGITIGGKLMGVIGMLFGVPVITIIYTLLKNAVREREERENS